MWEASEGEERMREQLASFNEFNDPGPERRCGSWLRVRGGFKDASRLERSKCWPDWWRKRKAVPPKPQADARVELTIKLVACEYLEENLLMTGSHWGSEMGLGNLISIV